MRNRQKAYQKNENLENSLRSDNASNLIVEKATGYLLSNTGVNLEEYSLMQGVNIIIIKSKKRGNYVFRVEIMNEVAVKQVCIFK